MLPPVYYNNVRSCETDLESNALQSTESSQIPAREVNPNKSPSSTCSFSSHASYSTTDIILVHAAQ